MRTEAANLSDGSSRRCRMGLTSRMGGGLAVLQEVVDGGEIPECRLRNPSSDLR